jgi:hypothetical protein
MKDWKAYVLRLPQHSQLKMLVALLHWQIDELKGDSLRFMAAEDLDYQGAFTVNDHIYWTSCGKNILE